MPSPAKVHHYSIAFEHSAIVSDTYQWSLHKYERDWKYCQKQIKIVPKQSKNGVLSYYQDLLSV